jgi:hypothetical protein
MGPLASERELARYLALDGAPAGSTVAPAAAGRRT